MLALLSRISTRRLLAPIATGPSLRLSVGNRHAAAATHPAPATGVPDTDGNQEAPLEHSSSRAPRCRIFQELGGAAGLQRAVHLFYNKVLTDPELMPYFKDVDMQKQRSKQVQFMSFVFGGPEHYQLPGGRLPTMQGRSMRDSHRDMVEKQGLRTYHFDRIKRHLGATLLEMGVQQDVIERAAGVVESTRQEFGFPPD